jgi:predicted NUDIX family phosphoesterase
MSAHDTQELEELIIKTIVPINLTCEEDRTPASTRVQIHPYFTLLEEDLASLTNEGLKKQGTTYIYESLNFGNNIQTHINQFDTISPKQLVLKGNVRRRGKSRPQDQYMMVFSMENKSSI